MNEKQAIALLEKYQNGECTPEEEATITQWLDSIGNRPETAFTAEQLQQFNQLVETTIHRETGIDVTKRKRRNAVVRYLSTAWRTGAAAAAILVILGVSAYFYYTTQTLPDASAKVTPQVKTEADALPGTDKAILTLADGRQIQLDSSANVLLAQKGITNNDALITYSNAHASNAPNTLSTPRGGQYKIRLSDGTMVWLNAASSITYPTTFTGKTREVTITGEAYFEVKTNPSKPFIVKTSKENISVLGTSFNVNAYADERTIKTTLIEGSVKIGNILLKPGQAYRDGKVVATNITQDIAWKNGVFDFNGVSVEQAMRQISRWYNIDIVYETTVPRMELVGEIDRNTSLNGLLRGLDGMVGRFRLDQHVLYVRPL